MKIHLESDYVTKEIKLNGKILDPKKSMDVWNYCPTGFMWGHGGSGSSQLALAILLEFLPQNEAVDRHEDFKWKVIARLPQAKFDLEIDISKWLASENSTG
ncbi:MAG: DUF6166 domain-containing protein [Spirochaetota bacterium]|nr:DUF6166 domain-containing protein [Spirochaetota bacterium]